MAELGVREQSLRSHRNSLGEEEEPEEEKVLLHPQGSDSTLDVEGNRDLKQWDRPTARPSEMLSATLRTDCTLDNGFAYAKKPSSRHATMGVTERLMHGCHLHAECPSCSRPIAYQRLGRLSRSRQRLGLESLTAYGRLCGLEAALKAQVAPFRGDHWQSKYRDYRDLWACLRLRKLRKLSFLSQLSLLSTGRIS